MVAGLKKPKLSTLARDLPTAQEIENYPELLKAESDRGAALMAGSFTENALYVAICARIADPGDVIRKQWFEGPSAPFATFAAKITLGRALGIYGPGMEKRLGIVKQVRNQFAHSSRPLDFSHPLIVSACKGLVPDGEKYEKLKARSIYSAATLALAHVLVADAKKHGGKEIKTSFP